MEPYLETGAGVLYQQDALACMEYLPRASCRLIIADPPYNIGKASWDGIRSADEYIEWSTRWIASARGLLTPDGTMYVCGFPEQLAGVAAAVASMFSSFRWLVWSYRNKAGMHDDWGRSHEALLHLRNGRRMVFNTDDVRIPYNRHTLRYPERTQAESSRYAHGGARREATAAWVPHPGGARPRDVIEVPALCNGSAEKTVHPTQKPEELIRRLVLASSNPGDVVLDPFGGSGTTYAVCEAAGRRWIGIERDNRYCRLIATRLSAPVRHRARQAAETPHDRANRRRRLREGP